MLKRFAVALAALLLPLAGMASPAQASAPKASGIVVPPPIGGAGVGHTPGSGFNGSLPVHITGAKKYAPPARKGSFSALSVNPQYWYAGGQQDISTAPQAAIAANAYVANPPTVDTNDHSLMEITAQTGSSPAFREGVVEIGWVKGNPFTDGLVHLFVGRWINGVFGGSYTGSGDGWIDATPKVHTDDPGVSLPTGAGKNFQWIYGGSCSGGQPGWFGYYNGAGIGCYPGQLWSGASPSVSFTASKFAQGFGEVYDDNTGSPAGSVPPCTDMGTGILATGSGTRGNFTGVKYTATTFANFGTWNIITDSSKYNTLPVNVASQGGTGANSFVDGPGAC
jgi:hypothetical protein